MPEPIHAHAFEDADPLAVSPEVAQAAASIRTEAEARVQIAERAFFSIVKTASELTMKGLPPGKTVAQALERAIDRKKALWSRDMDEDDRIDELIAYCTGLYGGDARAGQLLATAAIWGD
jgi:hypothetical protein